MGVFSRKKVTEDVPVEEKRQEEAKTASSVKSVLEGSPMDILLKSCIGRGFFWKRK